MRNWLDVLPDDVATAQHRWERNAKIKLLYADGYVCREIGEMLGLSAGRVQQVVKTMARPEQQRSPIEKYLARCEVFNPRARPFPASTGRRTWRQYLHPQPGYEKRRELYANFDQGRYSAPRHHWLYWAEGLPAPHRHETTPEYVERLLHWSDKAMADYAARRPDLPKPPPEGYQAWSRKLAREALRKTYLRSFPYGEEAS